MPVSREAKSCMSFAIVGLVGSVLAAILLITDRWFDPTTADEARRKRSIAFEDILARNEDRITTAERSFNQQRLIVTGVVTAKRQDRADMPVLFLDLPRDRAVRVTLNGTSTAFYRLGEGDRVSVDCESVRLVGREDPHMALRGCDIV